MIECCERGGGITRAACQPRGHGYAFVELDMHALVAIAPFFQQRRGFPGQVFLGVGKGR